MTEGHRTCGSGGPVTPTFYARKKDIYVNSQLKDLQAEINWTVSIYPVHPTQSELDEDAETSNHIPSKHDSQNWSSEYCHIKYSTTFHTVACHTLYMQISRQQDLINIIFFQSICYFFPCYFNSQVQKHKLFLMLGSRIYKCLLIEHRVFPALRLYVLWTQYLPKQNSVHSSFFVSLR